MATYCVLVLGFQLSLAAAYGLLPAGRAAILSLTELGFTWLLDTALLREATDPLAAVGILAIFCGSAISSVAESAAVGSGAAGGRLKKLGARSGESSDPGLAHAHTADTAPLAAAYPKLTRRIGSRWRRASLRVTHCDMWWRLEFSSD